LLLFRRKKGPLTTGEKILSAAGGEGMERGGVARRNKKVSCPVLGSGGLIGKGKKKKKVHCEDKERKRNFLVTGSAGTVILLKITKKLRLVERERERIRYNEGRRSRSTPSNERFAKKRQGRRIPNIPSWRAEKGNFQMTLKDGPTH